MSEMKSTGRIHASVIGTGGAFYNPYNAVTKAVGPTQLGDEDKVAGEWIECVHDRRGFKALVDSSAVLPQCIKSYASNIAGFGIAVRYKDDKTEPDEAMERELAYANAVINHLSLECDTKMVFERVIEARETYGAAYIEVIRDPYTGLVAQIDFIEESPTITKSVRDKQAQTITIYREGQAISHRKRFCHYKQEIGGELVYFKEFGDPRVMNMHTGAYVEEGEPIAPQDQANEILEFVIGPSAYGEIRWRGNITGINGAYMAERLNWNYFLNGRHTPLLIFIKGGMLDEESESRLETYMANIKGEEGQHAFVLLCAEPDGSVVAGGEGEVKPDIELKDLSPMLQKDELFQEYINDKRKQVQSSFLLPDLYVGYTTEFNRATAQTAKQVTEEQAFAGEREELAWIVNNKLLADFRFQYVEAYFLGPDLSNPDDLYKLLNVCNNAGGLTPNKAKEIVYEQMGEQAEPYQEAWGEIPLQLARSQAQKELAQQQQGFGGYSATPDLESLGLQLTQQIQKATEADENPEIINVMKSVRGLLEDMHEQREDAEEAEPRSMSESH